MLLLLTPGLLEAVFLLLLLLLMLLMLLMLLLLMLLMLLVLMVHGAQGTAHIGEHTDIRQTIFQRDGDGRVADEQAMHGIASFRRLMSCDVGNCRSNKTHRVVERPAPTPAQIF